MDVNYSNNNYIKMNSTAFKMANQQIQNHVGPILDYRWEHFSELNCSRRIHIKDKQTISFSIQKGNDVYLCQNERDNTCYKIYLKEKCDIRSRQDFTSKRCNTENENQEQRIWEHFTITADGNRYNIKQYGCGNSSKINTSYTPEYLIVNGKWKLHSVRVYSINFSTKIEIEVENKFSNFENSCYGLLVKVSQTSNLTLELYNSVKCFESKANKKIDEWEEIKLCTFGSSNTKMMLRIKPLVVHSAAPVFITATLRHYEHDVRIATLTKTKNSHCCYDLKFGNKICSNELTIHSPVAHNQTCPPATIGINCIPCRKIFNQDNCGNHSVCDLARSRGIICSCPNGVEESNCKAPFIPPKPVIVYSVGNENVKLRFAPNSLEESPEKYEACWSYNNIKMRCENAILCKIWTGQLCIECKNLLSNDSIKFQVKTLGDNESQYNKFQEVTAKPGEKGPSQPKNITYFWDDVTNALTLMWNHPDIPNGPITMFSFYIAGIEIETCNVKEEQYEYAHTIEFQKLNVSWSNNVTIIVSAHNKNGINTTNCQIFTPPKQPKFLKDPIFISTSEKSFLIKVPQMQDINNTFSYMYVILTNTERLMESLMESEEKLFKCGQIQDRNNSWIVKNISSDMFRNDSIEIDNISCISPGCKVLILLENKYNGISRCITFSLNDAMGINDNKLLFLLIFPIIGIIAIIVCILIKSKSDRSYSKETQLTPELGQYYDIESITDNNTSQSAAALPLYEDIKEPITDDMDQINQTLPVPGLYEEIPEFPECVDIVDQSTIIWQKYISTTNSVSRCVKIQELEDYVKICLKTKEFEAQYKLFEEGQTKPWTCGVKQKNKSKNRYKNLAAYDHSRVILDIVNNDPSSDYINANYIDGYDINRAYIATQGPKSNTIVDFWRMIWQENVEYIIMIANIIEEGKKKIEKYWPDVNESTTYNDITVTCDEVVVFAMYESKLFRVSCGGKERIVEHLHFTAWPDHGMPFYPQTLAPFLKRTMTIPLGKSPVVVHCSAGIGRTGTLILCDISLRMAAKRGEIDIFFYLRKMREQRINMVDNINQYKLVHLVLIHCLVTPDYRVPCTEEMVKIFSDITSHKKICSEMKHLEDTLWQDEVMRNVCTKVKEPIIHQKNRFENILPDSYARVTLTPYPLTDESSTYINAIKVDGFCMPSKFIVTQYPLRETVGDIWRLVDEYEISLMVCLNELDFGDEENRRNIKIIHLNEWKYQMLHPETPTALLMTYEEISCLENSSNKILIACHDGTRASGLFATLCCVMDQINMERVYDICLAVRTVRHSRTEFVKEMEQFIFLYKCALEYVQKYEKDSKV